MRINLAIALLLIVALGVGSCTHEPIVVAGEDPDENPIPGCENNGLVCFESSVLPIFLSSCAREGCHDSQSQKEGYVLNNYNNIVRRGITAGNANESKLYRVLLEDGEDRMPPDVPLSQAQKDSIRVWITQGAKNTQDCNCFCDSTAYSYNAIIKPILNNTCVGCHKPGSLQGNVDLSSYAKVKIQAENGKLVGSVSHKLGYSAMPQGGKLPDCEIAQIRKWVDAGSNDN